MTRLEGALVSGLGKAADLTQMAWVRRQLLDLVGIDPHPGTVNLALTDDVNQSRWQNWRGLPGHVIKPDTSSFCSARCLPVRLAGRVPGAVLLPDTGEYPQEKVEVVSALPIRSHLSLEEGARVSLELCRPLDVRAVLFDIDGTLVDSVGAYLEVARIAAGVHGFEVTEGHVRQALATGSNFWKDVVPRERNDGKTLVKEMSAHAAREWPRVLREKGTLFEGIRETLDTLKEAGLVLAIVSGARPEVLELLSADKLLDRFDAVVLGTDVTKGKPDPEGIITCLRRLGVAPESAVYVGDASVDIMASHAAGVKSVGVLTGAGTSAMLSACGPDRLISTMARLPAVLQAA